MSATASCRCWIAGRFCVLWLGVWCGVAVGSGGLAPPAQAQERAEQELSPGIDETVTPDELLDRAHRQSDAARTVEDFTRIIQLCEEAQRAEPSPEFATYARRLLAWAHNRRGERLAEGEDEQAALADFERALEYDPDRWQAWHNRGVSFARQGRLDDALADFNHTLELNPRHGNAYFNRGELRYERQDYSGSIEDYSRAIELSPDDALAYNSRGHAWYRLREYEPAIRDYSAAIERDPQLAAAYTNRGDAYLDLRQYAEAASDYRSAIRIDPELGRAYQSAAWLMATCPDSNFRNPQLALEAAQKAVALDGREDFRYLDTLAAAYANAGDFDQAVEQQAEAVNQAPEELRDYYGKRLELYQRQEPYRDTQPGDVVEGEPAGAPVEGTVAPLPGNLPRDARPRDNRPRNVRPRGR